LASHARGWWITGEGSRDLSAVFRTDIAPSEWGEGALEVAVSYSALNYKDALALEGSRGVVRKTPLIPGIDAVGKVVSSGDGAYPTGDTVILTGWGHGEDRHGGLASRLVTDAHHVLALPAGLSAHQFATLGTAGLTAALAVSMLEKNGVTPTASSLPVAVTGAAGGVGSLAIFLLAQAGFSVVAITGRTGEADYLTHLGATEVVSRQEVLINAGKQLLAERYSAVIDQAGGELLATLLASLAPNGVAIACGLAGGSHLPTTVMPFILRGISLHGINSVNQPSDVRHQMWNRWASLAPRAPWSEIATTILLEEAGSHASRVLAGATRGRLVVQVEG
jgi:acrylyl-CoA reductase (NADPH)